MEVVDTYEGDTELCNVLAEASLTIEGLMAKGDAAAAAASGLVSITDSDFNRHYAVVLVEEPIEI